MNTQASKTNTLRSINRQARFLMSHHRQEQRNRQQSLLQRASEEIGQK
jgi:hypothetical protein